MPDEPETFNDRIRAEFEARQAPRRELEERLFQSEDAGNETATTEDDE